MTVKELINMLAEVRDKDQDALVLIHNTMMRGPDEDEPRAIGGVTFDLIHNGPVILLAGD